VSEHAVLLAVCVAYFAVVVVIGWVAWRRSSPGAEDYFLAGRTAKTVVLFMALFGTNVTPFVLMGIPGLAYHHGVGVFGYNAAIVALGIPVSFWLIGWPAWRAARRSGAITPAELYAGRLRSPALGVLLFVAFAVYTLPYLVTSVLGVGLAVSIFTHDAVGLPTTAGVLLLVTLGYTTAGGMRATMWTNVFQGAVFLCVVVIAFVLVADGLGGFVEATRRVAEHAPELLERGDRPIFSTASWGSWALAISLTVIAFPHMLVRVFAARDVNALKNACRLYPPALLLLWLPAVLFGVWGAAAIPGLEGAASDRIFPLLVQAHGGPLLRGLALAGILAAVMSTIDAQFLTLSSMLTRDVLRRAWPQMGAKVEVRWGRAFVLALAIATWVIVLLQPASIFRIASFAFSGYVMLVPTLYLGLRWARFTAVGAAASILAGNGVLVATWMLDAPPWGVLPVAWGLAAGIVAAVIGSRFGTPSPDGAVAI
jgi:SSS family solute:Na+ symporter